VIFCWVMHQQEIIDFILEKLDAAGCRVKCISLLADEATLRRRLTADVERGIRTEDVIPRSIGRIPLYQALDTVKVDTNGRTISEIAREIAQV